MFRFRTIALGMFLLVTSLACAETWLASRGVEIEYEEVESEEYGRCVEITDCRIPYEDEARVSVRIPSRLGSLPVRRIGYGAFEGCYELESVTIPTSVTYIGDFAFAECSGLKSVTIPAGVKVIDAGAFFGCSGLKSVSIPVGVTHIGDSAFAECSGLKSASIPAGVTYVGDAAFGYCRGLRWVAVPANVAYVGEDVFWGCSWLQNIEWPSERKMFYGRFVPGEPVSRTVSSLVGYAAKGLPAGLKFDAKTGTISGAATKADVTTTVMFSKKGESPLKARFSVGAFPVLTLECDSRMGQVTGGGTYAAGKKVTLKATPKKGYVFAGWYVPRAEDEYDDWERGRPLSGDVDWRTPSFPYVTGAEDITIYARFVPAGDDGRISALCCMDSDIRWDDWNRLDIWVQSDSLPTVRVTGLPAGLKYDAKTMKIVGKPTKPGDYTVTLVLSNATVKNVVETFRITVPNLVSDKIHGLDPAFGYYWFSVGVALDDSAIAPWAEDGYALKVSGLPAGLKYDAKTGRVAGVPTKPGVYTVTVTGTKKGAPTETATITVKVDALPEAAVGTFTGHVASYDETWEEEKDLVGAFTFTATAAGRLTAKVVTAQGTTSFAAPSWTSACGDLCTFHAVMADVKTGRTLFLSVSREGMLDGEFEDSKPGDGDGTVYGIDAVRNVFSCKWHFKASGGEDGRWRLSSVPTAAEADATVTLKDGTATVAGLLGGVKVGGTTVVRVEEDGWLRVRLPAFATVRGRMHLVDFDLHGGGGEATFH